MAATTSKAPLLMGGAIVAAAVYALVRTSDPPPAAPSPSPPVKEIAPSSDLPPGHPPIAPSEAADFAAPPPASIVWKPPSRWQLVQHPSTMRLATYRIPRAEGDAQDAELSVTRAGGDVDANAARWIGQFGDEGAKTAKRTEKKVSGFRVVVVEVSGTYVGMGGAPQPGTTLLGAIVETPGMSHFFKMTGPSKTVAAARAELDALVDSITPGS